MRRMKTTKTRKFSAGGRKRKDGMAKQNLTLSNETTIMDTNKQNELRRIT